MHFALRLLNWCYPLKFFYTNFGLQLQARAFFQAAFNLSPHMFEPHYNFASLTDKVRLLTLIWYVLINTLYIVFRIFFIFDLYNLLYWSTYSITCYAPVLSCKLLCFQVGDLQSSYTSVRRSVDAFPDHADSNELLKQLKSHFSMLWCAVTRQY